MDCDPNMFHDRKLVMLVLLLTLGGRVHTGEIFGGREAAPHSRPYMVILERHYQNNKMKYCGGFLLNEDFVMTAAHCQAEFYEVLLGVHSFHNKNEIQRILVKQAFPHKDYNTTGYTNDIMLLKLSSKATFNQKVKPIALPGQDDGSLPKSCMVSGWGKTVWNNTHMSPILMEANVTLTDAAKCQKENVYCSEGEVGPGEGDSGGPLVCEDGRAYGVVSSYKPKSGAQHVYSYTKIPDFKTWIDLIMENYAKL